MEATTAAAQARNIQIECSIESEDRVVRGDAQRLQQVLLNLLGNAVKFSSDGGRVRVRLTRMADELEVSVTDEGRGIAPALLSRVFDRFWQEDTSSRRSHTGLGLGLAIVKHLVELHGGRVHASSPGEGHGATFTVRLPALGAGTPAQVSRALQPAETATADDLRGLRILVVDDDRDALRWMRQILTGACAEVEAAHDVGQALASVQQFAPGVLVSDIAMPHQDGFDLVKYLRRSGYDAQRLPAIALTAFASADDKRRALDAGFQTFLSKPIDPAELIGAVAKLAGRTS
jgi:CheY-like chemotaxis protein